MTGDVHEARATLAAWRDQGLDRLDPPGFAWMQALAQRAARQDTALRALLEARLRQRMEAYAARLRCRPAPADATARPPPPAPRASALSPLLEHLARQTALRDAAFTAPAAQPATPVLDEALRACSLLRSESRLRQTLVEPPADAGPLNSASLVHRALQLMRAASPAYLQAMLAHVEALAWLEDLARGEAAAGNTLPLASGHSAPRKVSRRPRGSKASSA